MCKYQVGQRVRVKHHAGEWEGEITYCSDSWGDECEYEVSNAPVDMNVKYPNVGPWPPSGRWYPLLWESEIVEVVL